MVWWLDDFVAKRLIFLVHGKCPLDTYIVKQRTNTRDYKLQNHKLNVDTLDSVLWNFKTIISSNPWIFFFASQYILTDRATNKHQSLIKLDFIFPQHRVSTMCSCLFSVLWKWPKIDKKSETQWKKNLSGADILTFETPGTTKSIQKSHCSN